VRLLISSSRRDPREDKMVGLGGLEPPTSPLSGVRSNHLSYRPNVANFARGPFQALAFLDMQVSCVGALGGW
jgi:hypothetical protein